MVVTVVPARVMEVAVHQIIDVIAVRDGLMSAAFAMGVGGDVTVTGV